MCPDSWGNGALGQLDENIISDPDNGNILKVSDLEHVAGHGANKIALETANGNTGASARALKATGHSEFVGNDVQDSQLM